jgi:VWFA-related protein
MKKAFFVFILIFFSLILYPQTEQQTVMVSNVVVHARVFDGDQFVDNLEVGDFELYEDGVLQKIEALYLTDKSKIERSEEFKVYSPRTARNFYLIFQVTDYNPKFEEAFDFLFNEVLTPDDTLTIMTPVKNYNMPQAALSKYTPEQLSKEMQAIIRKDAKVGASNYRSIMNDLKRIVRTMSSSGSMEMTDAPSEGAASLDWLLPRYRDRLADLERSRIVNEEWFFRLAQELKNKQGQKNVFFFYEREFRPEISQSVYNNIESSYQDKPNIIAQARDLFQFYRRDTRLDVNKIKQVFADSALEFYFIFMNNTADRTFGIIMKEQSEDVFSAFREVTKSTGGIVDPSQNPAAGFKNAVNASKNCYLLYYTPTNTKKDGSFRNIVVKVKDKDYKIKFREGYFAF